MVLNIAIVKVGESELRQALLTDAVSLEELHSNFEKDYRKGDELITITDFLFLTAEGVVADILAEMCKMEEFEEGLAHLLTRVCNARR